MARELKATRLQREIEEAREKLEKHQAKCKHKRIDKTYKSNFNFDYTFKVRWCCCVCKTCLKHWKERAEKFDE